MKKIKFITPHLGAILSFQRMFKKKNKDLPEDILRIKRREQRLSRKMADKKRD